MRPRARSATRAAWWAWPIRSTAFVPAPAGAAGRTSWSELVPLLDYVETWNARLMIGDGNLRAAEFAAARGLPGVAVSDAHTRARGRPLSYTILDGPLDTAVDLRAALAGARLVTGPASRLRASGHADGQAHPAPARQSSRERRMSERAPDRAVPEETLIDYPGVHEESAPPAPLSRRLRDPRTIVSIVLPLGTARAASRSTCGHSTLAQLVNTILARQPVFSAGRLRHLLRRLPVARLPLAALLRGAGTHVSVRDSTEIIFISWLVNCLVPAKLGDVYRAWSAASRTSPSRSAERSARSSSSASSTSSRSPSSDWRPASGASAATCRAEVQVVFAIGLAVVLR